MLRDSFNDRMKRKPIEQRNFNRNQFTLDELRQALEDEYKGFKFFEEHPNAFSKEVRQMIIDGHKRRVDKIKSLINKKNETLPA